MFRAVKRASIHECVNLYRTFSSKNKQYDIGFTFFWVKMLDNLWSIRTFLSERTHFVLHKNRVSSLQNSKVIQFLFFYSKFREKLLNQICNKTLTFIRLNDHRSQKCVRIVATFTESDNGHVNTRLVTHKTVSQTHILLLSVHCQLLHIFIICPFAYWQQ